MDQLDHAVYKTAHSTPESCKALATKMGVSYQVLVNKTNSNNDTHHLTLREALAMMLLSGNTQIIEAMANELNLSVRPRDTDIKPLIDSLLAVNSEQGDVNTVIHSAFQDRKITPSELSDIRKEIQEARAALDDLEKSATAHSVGLVAAQ